MSFGFQICLGSWELKGSHHAKLESWIAGVFVDAVWQKETLLGWSFDSYTAPRMRELVTNNLKNWGCVKKGRRYQKGWVKPLSAAEFMTLAGRAPRPVQTEVKQLLDRVFGKAVQRVVGIIDRREKAAQKADEANRLLAGAVFKALRDNAPWAAEQRNRRLEEKIARLRAHLDALAVLRTEHPEGALYLPEDWETVTPEEERVRLQRRGIKRPWVGSFRREDEERREAEILRLLVEQI